MKPLCTALMWCLALTCGSLAQDNIKSANGKGAYCSQVKDYARQHADKALLFMAIPQNRDPARDHWTRISSAAALKAATQNANSSAKVHVRDQHVIFVDFTFQNQFGDSTQTTQYCFRPEGTLAELHSELKSFHGDMSVLRDITFDDAGRRVSQRMQSFDLETGRPKKLPSDFWDFSPPIFLHVGDLPFAQSLPGNQ
jgi:hypothetical protein